MRLSLELKNKYNTMLKKGVSKYEIYKEYQKDTKSNSTFTSFKKRIKEWSLDAEVGEELIEKASLGYNFIPHGATVQTDGNGNVERVWFKSDKISAKFDEVLKAIDKLPKLNLSVEKPEISRKRLLEIFLTDAHFGVATYEDYLPIRNKILATLENGYDEVVIPIGSDLFHVDNIKNTTMSGTQVQEINIGQAVEDAYKFYGEIITTAIKNSNKVKVIYVKGNHDASVSYMFVNMLSKVFKGVDFDLEIDEWKSHSYEEIFLAFHHGDKKNKPQDLYGIMMNLYKQKLLQASTIEIHTGHLHGEDSKDHYGVMCRTLSTAVPTDRWHRENGFLGKNKRFMLFEYDEKSLIATYFIDLL